MNVFVKFFSFVRILFISLIKVVGVFIILNGIIVKLKCLNGVINVFLCLVLLFNGIC